MNKSTKNELLVAAGIMYANAAVLFCDAAEEKNKIMKKKLNKREWVKIWRLRRQNKGSFTLLHDELRLEDKDMYRQFLRMDENCFIKILNYVKPSIEKQSTQMREPISAEEGLAVILRFLATGETYRSLDFQTRLSRQFIGALIPNCCAAIYLSMKEENLKFPSSFTEWEDISNDYFSRWQFPLCLGAIDGKHIAFRASKSDGALYYNYKGFNSIALLAMCDARYRFSFIDVGCNGRVSDGGVLNRSDLGTILSNPSIYFPPDKIIGNNRKLPYCIIGDDAFALQKHLLKPYPYASTETTKKVFNFRLSHARQCIEHSFGMLANRFRVLQTNIHLSPEKVKQIVEACCTLHNFLVENGSTYADTTPSGPRSYKPSEDDISGVQRRPQQAATYIRDEFAAYFTEEGELPWQHLYI